MPAWVQTVHKSVEEGDVHIRVGCDRCGEWRDVDLEALAKKVDANYSLINRRCKCRLTPGCDGWNRFFYQRGVFRNLWTIERGEIWLERDRRAKQER